MVKALLIAGATVSLVKGFEVTMARASAPSTLGSLMVAGGVILILVVLGMRR